MRVSYAGDEQAYVANEKEVIETLKEFKKKPVPVVKQNCYTVYLNWELMKNTFLFILFSTVDRWTN